MFPNLAYGMALRGVLGYQLAFEVGMHESRFSRCQRGRLAFTPTEMSRVAEILGFDQAWLFSRPAPPRAASMVSAEVVTAG